jgi:hypothetical protein
MGGAGAGAGAGTAGAIDLDLLQIHTPNTAPELRMPPGLTEREIAMHLYQQGWAVIPLRTEDVRTVMRMRQNIFAALQDAPEFDPDLPFTHTYSKTGFGALGTASSFHNAEVRQLRRDAYFSARPIFRHLASIIPTHPLYMDEYVDRLMIRQGKYTYPGSFTASSGQSATAESWHRDESVDEMGRALPDDDTVFGGWINLNPFEENFLGAPGTHFTDRNRGRGFGKIKDEDELRDLNIRLRKVVIPARHLFIFYENMAHQVVAKAVPARTTQMRLFTGFRLTGNPVTPYLSVTEDLQYMRVMPLKSGQVPVMFNDYAMNGATQRDGLERWTLTTMRKDAEGRPLAVLVQYYETKSGRFKGDVVLIPRGPGRSLKRTSPSLVPMPALREYDPATRTAVTAAWVRDVLTPIQLEEFNQTYPPYTIDELSFYLPRAIA